MLVVIDGTWASDPSEEGEDTNCGRIYRSCQGPKLYLSGVGAGGGPIGKWLGGAFGFGGKGKIISAMDWITTHDIPPEGVDIVGWSRGAALACELSHRCNDEGIPVRFLGLFDMVANFGLPGRVNLGYRLHKPRAAWIRHAMAAHCSNRFFKLSRVKPLGPFVRECWFRGNHRNIGAGEPALKWMYMSMRAVGCPISRPAQGDRVPIPDSKPFPTFSRRRRPGDCLRF